MSVGPLHGVESGSESWSLSAWCVVPRQRVEMTAVLGGVRALRELAHQRGAGSPALQWFVTSVTAAAARLDSMLRDGAEISGSGPGIRAALNVRLDLTARRMQLQRLARSRDPQRVLRHAEALAAVLDGVVGSWAAQAA